MPLFSELLSQHLHLLLSIAAPAGMVVCNWVVILSVCITVLCVFDPTGRTFVKLRATKRRQRNLRTYNLRSVGRGWAVPWWDVPYTSQTASPPAWAVGISPRLSLSLPQFPGL